MKELEHYTLKEVLKESSDRYGNKVALGMVGGESVSYNKLAEQVKIISRVLKERGIQPGDKVAILSENKPNWGIAYFAITVMGSVAVPILPDFHPSEIHHILRHSSAKAIFISKDQYAKFEDAPLVLVETIFIIEDFSIVPPYKAKDKLREILLEGQREFIKLRDAAMKITGLDKLEVKEDDIASIIYTSGTTGHSKGVMLTHRNLIYDACATLEIQKVSYEDRLLSILPLSHAYEFTIGFLIPFIQGASIFYLDKPPVARVLLPALQKVRPTMMLTVPLIIEKIYKTKILHELHKNVIRRGLMKFPPTRKLLHKVAAKKILATFGGKLRFFGIGGAALSPETERFLRDGKFPYAIGYGMTEASPLISGSSVEKTRFRAAGFAIPEQEIRIKNPDKKTGEGEIIVRGDNVMKGYFRDPDQTKEVISKDGWLRTGDLGYIDKDGYLFIKGRLKNVILGPSGENIYPEEIESKINRSDYVLESLVYKEDSKIVARVYLNYEELDVEFTQKKLTQTQITRRIQELLEDLRKEVNENLSSFSRIMRMIEQTEPFEKTPTKKIKRYLYISKAE
ncbi:MAG TPA: long-chain fatty acid--CoA ligase [Candidatus Cloacimonetes bacterium]|nr:long-chain fatty acid--CoA ligase [Candidatus Cloacimonadota bacterium]HEX37253.1 long-chain fatty acid--CoA ligase [Candidatus Cloacimonadota bacterium]